MSNYYYSRVPRPREILKGVPPTLPAKIPVGRSVGRKPPKKAARPPKNPNFPVFRPSKVPKKPKKDVFKKGRFKKSKKGRFSMSFPDPPPTGNFADFPVGRVGGTAFGISRGLIP